jgi:hypothetical protein
MKNYVFGLNVGSGLFDALRVNMYTPPILVEDLWYSYFAASTAGGLWQVGLATSRDGISFTSVQNSSVLSVGAGGSVDESGLLFPEALYVDNTWFVFYAGLSAAGVLSICAGIGKEAQSLRKQTLVPGSVGVYGCSGPIQAEVIPLKISNTPPLYETRYIAVRVFYTYTPAGGVTTVRVLEFDPRTFERV